MRCLLAKLHDPAARVWYAHSATEQGWSRKLLEHHIATRRYEREGKALSNFSRTLQAPESELVEQIVHEDYNFWRSWDMPRNPFHSGRVIIEHT